MAFQLPSNSPTVAGQVRDPSLESSPNGTNLPMSVSQSGTMHVDTVHGKFYNIAKRGNLFMASTLVAGVTVPAPATTLASKAGMRNPLNSGVNVELVALCVNSVTIDVALKQFALEFQLNCSTTGGVPTSNTDLTSYSMPMGAGLRTSLAKAYTASTSTNASANPIILWPFGTVTTAVGTGPPSYVRFDGEIVFGPDTLMMITCTAALAAVNVSYIWAEWPI